MGVAGFELTPPSWSLWFSGFVVLGVAMVVEACACIPLFLVRREYLRSRHAAWRLATLAVGLAGDCAMAATPYVLHLPYGLPRYSMAVIVSISCFRVLEVALDTAPPERLQTFPAMLAYVLTPFEKKSQLSTWREVTTVSLWHLASAAYRAALHIVFLSALLYLQRPDVRGSVWWMNTFFGRQLEFALVAVAFLLFLSSSFEFLHVMAAPLTHLEPVPFTDDLLGAKTVNDFWCRWNTLVHIGFKRTIFLPLKRQGVPIPVAALLVFLLSGLFHAVLLFHGYGVWSWETVLFFIANYAAAALQQHMLMLQNRLFTLASLLATCSLFMAPLMHPTVAFIQQLSHLVPIVVYNVV
eukprot:TRINITY_DN6907_c0_g1_i1.p1 TRINITY_DN6907_c0_g1~~TRINITY_DN6907_c0_g1_i1.p1  ORF type:complete len:353 (+),score=62.54 TRINITY_DN6907_c0_g1_i1:969-2027(+)